jgi:hypothetical protein
MQLHIYFSNCSIFFFLTALGLELRASCLPDSHSTESLHQHIVQVYLEMVKMFTENWV